VVDAVGVSLGSLGTARSFSRMRDHSYMKANATREQTPNAGATRRPRQMRFSDDGTLHYISSAR
jgi:hypothetical protein